MQPTSLLVTQIAFVLIATLSRVAAAELACQDSGYCSLGKLAPFVGDVHPSNCRRVYGRFCNTAEYLYLTRTRLSVQVQGCIKH